MLKTGILLLLNMISFILIAQNNIPSIIDKTDWELFSISLDDTNLKTKQTSIDTIEVFQIEYYYTHSKPNECKCCDMYKIIILDSTFIFYKTLYEYLANTNKYVLYTNTNLMALEWFTQNKNYKNDKKITFENNCNYYYVLSKQEIISVTKAKVIAEKWVGSPALDKYYHPFFKKNNDSKEYVFLFYKYIKILNQIPLTNTKVFGIGPQKIKNFKCVTRWW